MSKILYMNLLDQHNSGGKNLDKNIIRVLAKYHDVTVASVEDWYEGLPQKVRTVEYKPWCAQKKGSIAYFLRNLQNIIVACKLDRKNHFDYIFFCSYETQLFIFSQMIKNRSNRVYIMQQNNIDYIDTSRLKKFCFSLYSHKVNHVVLDEGIKKYLLSEYKVSKEKVFVINHPLNFVNRINNKKYDCVGISNSNDEEIINCIIENEVKNHTISDLKLSVVLRSRKTTFDNGYLKVIKGKVSEAVYDDYISNAKVIFLPYEKNFRYRMSGLLVDAFSNNIPVICSKAPLFVQYEAVYSEICRTLSDASRFVTNIKELSSVKCSDQFEQFKKLHSDEMLEKTLIEMFM